MDRHPFHSTELEEIVGNLGLPDAPALGEALRALDLPGIVHLETAEGPVDLFDRGAFKVGQLDYQLASVVLGSEELILFRRDGDNAVVVEHAVELEWVDAQPAYRQAVEDSWVDAEDAERALELLATVRADHDRSKGDGASGT